MSEPHDWPHIAQGMTWAGVAGLAGRLMAHAQLVRRGKRRLMGVQVLWEAPTAFGMGLIGQGVADYFQFNGTIGLAVITSIAYLGPQSVEAAYDVLLRRFGVSPPAPPPDPQIPVQ